MTSRLNSRYLLDTLLSFLLLGLVRVLQFLFSCPVGVLEAVEVAARPLLWGE